MRVVSLSLRSSSMYIIIKSSSRREYRYFVGIKSISSAMTMTTADTEMFRNLNRSLVKTTVSPDYCDIQSSQPLRPDHEETFQSIEP